MNEFFTSRTSLGTQKTRAFDFVIEKCAHNHANIKNKNFYVNELSTYIL